ncbi:MAG TPA: DUF1080 domain-containing protein [Puia sp.]|jgi:hypothetical protein
MKKIGISIMMLMVSVIAVRAQEHNQLTEAEKKDGWKLLFNGTSTAGWHTYNKSTFGPAWRIVDGTLFCDSTVKIPKGEEGDICTEKEYENFDLKYSWKIAKNGNSGVMFLVQESKKLEAPYLSGPEMQVLDNDGHPDGKIHKHRAGDLYDLIASSSEPVHPVGEWNDAEIKLDHGKLNLYLNGVNVVSTTMWDANWDALVKGSKFSQWPTFAKSKKGHIDLQDHGCDVWFRDIKIKTL